MSERQTNERVRLWLERAGAGFRLRDAATGELVRGEDPRIRVIKVAGVSYRLDALQNDAFAPGRRLARVLEVDDWQAVTLWEFFEDGRRGGLRVLLAPRDAWIGLPRA